MGRNTLTSFGRNLPLLVSITLTLRGQLATFNSLCLIVGGSILTALLITWTERLLDADRTHFSWREVGSNTLLFTILGMIVVLYVRHGTYLFDVVVGLVLGGLTAGVQYLALGHEFFFHQRRALAAYAAALVLCAPFFLASLRLSLALTPLSALLLLGIVWLISSAVVVYFNYTLA